MKTFYLASRNRASDGAISHLKSELKKRGMLGSVGSSDYIIAVGDRTETFDMVLRQWRYGLPIIHLWAGESCSDWSTEDEVYRTSMTLMSMMQLCTNETAKKRVEAICNATNKKPNAHVIGNVMMDDLSVDESKIPKEPYILVLYNPPTLLGKEEIRKDLKQIMTFIDKQNLLHLWIEPNGDRGSPFVSSYVTNKSLPRKQFLGLLKNCKYFVTNSSSQFYEAPFFLKPDQIIPVGSRNKARESKDAEMKLPGATKRVVELLKTLG